VIDSLFIEYRFVLKGEMIFKKITFIFLTLSLAFFMSCEDGAGSATSEAGKEVAMEAAGMAMGMAMEISPSMEEMGLSISRVAAMDVDPSTITTPEGLTVAGTYTSEFTESGYDLDSILSMNFENVMSDDGVWTMNGNLVSTLNMTMTSSPVSFSMEGTLRGNLSVSDGSNEYSFVFDITQTLETISTGFSCTVSGTVVSGSSTITLNETFTFSS
jgi:hypothetical protein